MVRNLGVLKEYKSLCNRNGVTMLTFPSYRSSTNEAAENSVRTFKSCLLKCMKSNRSNMSISTMVSSCLFTYIRKHRTG